MRRKLATITALAACAGALAAFRPPDQNIKTRTAWMTVSSLKTGREYYLELSQDGRAVLREENSRKLQTRRGAIAPQLALDFFREIDNSEIINSQSVKRNRIFFYSGEMLRISSYVSGDLLRTQAPLDDFGEAFSHALREVKKAAGALPQDTALHAFLRAERLEGEALDSFREKNTVDGIIKNIETADINRVKPLMAAIKEPYRLVPLETAAEARELQDFVSAMRLHGLYSLFYVPSTRGAFKCQVIDAVRPRPGQKNSPAGPH